MIKHKQPVAPSTYESEAKYSREHDIQTSRLRSIVWCRLPAPTRMHLVPFGISPAHRIGGGRHMSCIYPRGQTMVEATRATRQKGLDLPASAGVVEARQRRVAAGSACQMRRTANNWTMTRREAETLDSMRQGSDQEANGRELSRKAVGT